MSNETEKFSDTSHWDKKSQEYEDSTMGLTRRFAVHGINLVGVPDDSVVLDNACGPAIVTEEVLKINPNVKEIFACDFSEGMIKVTENKAKQNNWTKVKAEVQNAQDLKFEDNRFDRSFFNFGIFFSEDDRALQHVYRTLKPGGIAVIATWESVGHHNFAIEVAQRISGKTLAPKGEGSTLLNGGWTKKEWIREKFIRIGFKDVKTETKRDEFYFLESFMNYPRDMWKKAFIEDGISEEKFIEMWDKVLKEKIESKEMTHMTAIFTVGTK